jgi:hypothetical protein
LSTVAALVAPQQRMARARQRQALAAHLGRRPVGRARQPHARPQEVGARERALARLERGPRGAHQVRQRAQHAHDLVALARGELGEVVVQRAHLERLDEQRLPARRRVVHQALAALEAVGAHGDHEAVAPCVTNVPSSAASAL